MDLIFDFSREDFISTCVSYISRSNTTVIEDIRETFNYYINPLYCKNEGILDIKCNNKYDSWKSCDKHWPLQMYIDEREQINTGYYRFDISAEKKCDLSVENIFLPSFLATIFGRVLGIWTGLRCNMKPIKTKNRATVELITGIIINDNLVLSILETLKSMIIEYDYFLPAHHQVGEWRQVFYNKATGESFFCSCFKKAISKHPHSLGADYNDRILQDTLKARSFRDGICHLCRQKPSDLYSCHPMYGSSFKVRYGAYIQKTAYELDIDEREAENIVREQVGIPKIGEKWLNETMLYKYIVTLYPAYEIQREASPEWLYGQRFDIYIPELALAIEYQGEQHFKPVELFGGKEGLAKTKARDKAKQEKCDKNNIRLVYFTYKDNLSEKLIETRLKPNTKN